MSVILMGKQKVTEKSPTNFKTVKWLYMHHEWSIQVVGSQNRCFFKDTNTNTLHIEGTIRISILLKNLSICVQTSAHNSDVLPTFST